MYALEIPADAIPIPLWCLGNLLLTEGAMTALDAPGMDLDKMLVTHLFSPACDEWIKPANRAFPQFSTTHNSGREAFKIVSQRGNRDSPVQRDQTIVCLLQED